MNKVEQDAEVFSIQKRMEGLMICIHRISRPLDRPSVDFYFNDATALKALLKEIDVHLRNRYNHLMAEKLEDTNESTD